MVLQAVAKHQPPCLPIAIRMRDLTWRDPAKTEEFNVDRDHKDLLHYTRFPFNSHRVYLDHHSFFARTRKQLHPFLCRGYVRVSSKTILHGVARKW